MSRENIIGIVWLSVICLVIYFAIVNSFKNDEELRKHKQEIDSIRNELEFISKSLQHRIEVQTKFIEMLHKLKDTGKIFYKIEKLIRVEETLNPKESKSWRDVKIPLTENEFNYHKSIQEMITKDIEELLKQN